MSRLAPWTKALISVGILAALAWLLPWEAVRGAFARVRPTFLLLLVVLFLGGHLVGVLKWRFMVGAFGGYLGWLDAVRCYAAGLFGNLCLPGLVGGDVVRGLAAARTLGRLEPPIMGGVADRVIDLLALVPLILGGATIVGLPMLELGSAGTVALLVILSVPLMILLVIALKRPLRAWPVKLRRPIARVLLALRHLRAHPRYVVRAFLMATAIQAGFVFLNSRIGLEVGIDLPLAVWFVVWPLAKLSGLLPISLGGLGVRDAAQGGLLMSFGVPASLGVVASLVWQAVLIAGGLVAGVTWLVLALRRSGSTSPKQLYRTMFSGARGSNS